MIRSSDEVYKILGLESKIQVQENNDTATTNVAPPASPRQHGQLACEQKDAEYYVYSGSDSESEPPYEEHATGPSDHYCPTPVVYTCNNADETNSDRPADEVECNGGWMSAGGQRLAPMGFNVTQEQLVQKLQKRNTCLSVTASAAPQSDETSATRIEPTPNLANSLRFPPGVANTVVPGNPFLAVHLVSLLQLVADTSLSLSLSLSHTHTHTQQ